MTRANQGAVGVAASAALVDLLTGTSVQAAVRGAGRVACYLDVGCQVVVIETVNGAGLPNAVQLGPESPPVPALRGDAVLIGRGALRGAGWHLVVHRWWDPQVAVGPITTSTLIRAARYLAATSSSDLRGTTGALTQAVRTGRYHRIAEASRALVGRGPGLTPAGDDLLVGLLAALRVLGPALATPATTRTAQVADMLASAVVHNAAARTTALSTQLLTLADRGAVALPVAAVLRAIAADRRVPETVVGLTRIGHTSGRHLLDGIAIALDAMLSFSQSAPVPDEERTA